MQEPVKALVAKVKNEHVRPAVSALLPDGSLVETVYRPEANETLFCLGAADGAYRFERSVLLDGERLVPYSPRNNLLQNEVVLFPSEPEEYRSEKELVSEIQAFIHRYVDVSPLFETIASYYVLLTWVYDAFNELPYLRLRGDPGSGKTRFLLTVGSLCYKPIFASGASTISPIFRILDTFRGTLLIDEGDFRLSDEKAEIVKILNNGNARGFPVLRSEVTPKKEFNPTAFHVFGPKIVATRGFFQDRALESRCLTEEMGQDRLRVDIPINLPSRYKDEALHLRNRLLLFRMKNLSNQAVSDALVDRSLEPRLNQIFVPLMSIIEDEAVRNDLRGLALRYQRELVADRGTEAEAQVLEVIRDLLAAAPPTLTVKDITALFTDRHGEDYDRKITTKWIGWILRRKLHLRTERSRTGFAIPTAETARLPHLFERYGLESEAHGHDASEPLLDQGAP